MTKNKEDIKENNNRGNCEDKIKELETTIVDLENKWKRALADYSNQQKRFNEEKESIRKLANELLILDLLPVLDNMEMLNKHVNDEGFKMIFKEMLKTLSDSGLEEIKVDGLEFNALNMEAVDTEEGENNKVLRIEQKGYLLNGKLIRPAKVIVGKTNKEE